MTVRPTRQTKIERNCFKGKRILVTGGLGFIGSNLAIRLVHLGANVTVMDAMLKGSGANFFNIASVKKDITVSYGDVRDSMCTGYLVRNQDYVFHLAGQNDHVLSLSDPFPDIDINIKGAAVLLEACRKNKPGVKLVYAGTRGEYGTTAKLPVNEDAPVNPKGIYELSSLTAQKMFQIYNNNGHVRSICLRLTNIYGERAQMKHDRFGVANWFIRRALDRKPIEVFGDGSIIRDFLYVGDAVDALLCCAACETAYGHVYNVGHDRTATFLDLAKTIVHAVGNGSKWRLVAFSPERAAQEPGHYCSDITKIGQMVGWKPRHNLEDGVRKTVRFYRQYKTRYW